MNINVVTASGELDEYVDVTDALEDQGFLIVVTLPEEGDDLGELRTMIVTKRVPQPRFEPGGTEPELASWTAPMKLKIDDGPPMMEVSTTFVVESIYAQGMWVKVEFPRD